MMGEIVICKKPDTITYEDIWQFIYNAHAENREKGIFANSKISNGERLREHQGENSVCFLAMDGAKIVGTLSVRVEKRYVWGTGRVLLGYIMSLAVDSAYRGQGIGSVLFNEAETYAEKNGAEGFELRVLEKNPAIKMYAQRGYLPVEYIPQKYKKAFAVAMIKWVIPHPFGDCLRKVRYKLKRSLLNLKYRW